MKRKLEISELIFKIISYLLLTVFALCCLYPFVYAISASISGRAAVDYNHIGGVCSLHSLFSVECAGTLL